MKLPVMGVESGGGGDGGDAPPPVTNLGRDVPSRFDDEVAQIRCLFRFLGYFGDRLANITNQVYSLGKSGAPREVT